MTRSVKGTVERPGRKVRAKAGLNRAILAQGWATFAALLDYKLTERGGRLVMVNPVNTSRACAACGVVDARSRESQADFACIACGHRNHADTNAAKNIDRRGNTPLLGVEVSHLWTCEASTIQVGDYLEISAH